jgi:c(7)-type cytochrome triheme protein
MKKVLIFAVAAGFVFSLTGLSLAVGPGKKLEFDEKTTGKVVLDGKAHADKGLKCKDCHPTPFKMKKTGEKVTMADINAGKSCGVCHNDKKAFGTKDCSKCHTK